MRGKRNAVGPRSEAAAVAVRGTTILAKWYNGLVQRSAGGKPLTRRQPGNELQINAFYGG